MRAARACDVIAWSLESRKCSTNLQCRQRECGQHRPRRPQHAGGLYSHFVLPLTCKPTTYIFNILYETFKVHLKRESAYLLENILDGLLLRIVRVAVRRRGAHRVGVHLELRTLERTRSSAGSRRLELLSCSDNNLLITRDEASE